MLAYQVSLPNALEARAILSGILKDYISKKYHSFIFKTGYTDDYQAFMAAFARIDQLIADIGLSEAELNEARVTIAASIRKIADPKETEIAIRIADHLTSPYATTIEYFRAIVRTNSRGQNSELLSSLQSAAERIVAIPESITQEQLQTTIDKKLQLTMRLAALDIALRLMDRHRFRPAATINKEASGLAPEVAESAATSSDQAAAGAGSELATGNSNEAPNAQEVVTQALQTRITELEAQLSVAKTAVPAPAATTEAKVAELTALIAVKDQELEAKRELIRQAQAQNQAVIGQLEELNNRLPQAREAEAAAKAQAESAAQAADELRVQLQTSHAAHARLESANGALQRQIEALQAENDRQQARIIELNDAATTSAQAAAISTASADGLSINQHVLTENLTRELATLKEKIDSLAQRLAAKNDSLAAMGREAAGKDQHIARLERQVREQTGLLSTVQNGYTALARLLAQSLDDRTGKATRDLLRKDPNVIAFIMSKLDASMTVTVEMDKVVQTEAALARCQC